MSKAKPDIIWYVDKQELVKDVRAGVPTIVYNTVLRFEDGVEYSFSLTSMEKEDMDFLVTKYINQPPK